MLMRIPALFISLILCTLASLRPLAATAESAHEMRRSASRALSHLYATTPAARSLSTTTARKSMYAFFFDQKGLMGGLGLQGTKITKIHPQ